MKRNDTTDNQFYQQRSGDYSDRDSKSLVLMQNISVCIENLKELMQNQICVDAKSFSINFKGKQYEFFFPSTKEEFKEQKKLKKRLCNLILLEVVKVLVTKPKKFDLASEIIRSLFWGEDPENHQIEMIKEEEISEDSIGVNASESGRKSIAIDVDNYQVRSNDMRYQHGMQILEEVAEEVKSELGKDNA